MINASFDFRSVCDTVAASSLDFYLTESANVCLTEWGDTELYAMWVCVCTCVQVRKLRLAEKYLEALATAAHIQGAPKSLHNTEALWKNPGE